MEKTAEKQADTETIPRAKNPTMLEPETENTVHRLQQQISRWKRAHNRGASFPSLL
jgi:hypothetical protein